MKAVFLSVALLLVPAAAHAQGLTGVIDTITKLINAAIPLVLALAVLYFFWGLASYIRSAGDEEKQKAARDMMIWGIIALFVMVSVWGLIRLLQDTFGINQNENPIIPGQIKR